MLDVAAMHQVLFNLVENALKFTDPPGDVGVRSTLQRPNWLLEVWDSGRGIPQADCERLFNSFQQSQEKDAQKGWGLGLFICRSIVMAHGGRIEVDSDLGKGAIFRVFLPLALD
jgi:signal transduction histidine kinase